MSGPSVLTIVRNRADHFGHAVEGLCRSSRPPGELVVVDMSDTPLRSPVASFPVRIVRLETDGLPLARARNLAAGAASGERLVFLDVDCIPMRGCIGALCAALDRHDALICADVRYLAAGATAVASDDERLLANGRAHPVRRFPRRGLRAETNPGLFWSLAFAVRKTRFAALGGFDEGFTGYGAEDTDFGFRAARAGLPLLFSGDATVCHQHHATYDPPLQHFDDIVRNAIRFHARWSLWPMDGWLAGFARLGLIEMDDGDIRIIRPPTADEIAGARLS